jgi:hypothetical protein
MTQEQPKRKTNKLLLLISGIALAASIGVVFATNTITINSGNGIEFGAGTAATSACDTSITTALSQTYSSTNSRFELSNIVLSGIADACNGKTVNVVVVGPNDNCGIDGATTIATPTLSSNAATLSSGADGFTLGATAITSGQTATITMPVAAGCDSTTVTKIGIATK